MSDLVNVNVYDKNETIENSESVDFEGSVNQVANETICGYFDIFIENVVLDTPWYPKCSYWNESKQTFESNGCEVRLNKGNGTHCACSHLTAFKWAKEQLKLRYTHSCLKPGKTGLSTGIFSAVLCDTAYPAGGSSF